MLVSCSLMFFVMAIVLRNCNDCWPCRQVSTGFGDFLPKLFYPEVSLALLEGYGLPSTSSAHIARTSDVGVSCLRSGEGDVGRDVWKLDLFFF